MIDDLDTDGSDQSVHHTLGANKGQASPGDHDHRGGSSVALLQGMTVSGSNATEMLASIVAILVDLGATDSTTVPKPLPVGNNGVQE
jgi:hypothetical protein